MTVIRIPYGPDHMEANIPADCLMGILESHAHHYKPVASEAGLVRNALENPIGSMRLRDLARNKKKIVIVTSDHTRPVPTRIMAPQLLAEIRTGNPDANVTFLVATGFHRASTEEELIRKFGEELYKSEKIVIHNAWDDAALINAGKLPSGGDLVINKMAMEADLLVAEGFIEPHLFAGYSGGRKSVLPGIVSNITVLANHCSEFIAHEKARAGILEGNPLHIDMLHAANVAKLAFILNVVIDANKKIIYAVAGDSEQAHLAGCEFVGELAAVDAKLADIVLTSNGGSPLDQNVYQLVKGLSSAEATCRQGGVIIICAACNDGHGSEDLYNWFKQSTGGAKEVMEKIMRIGRESTIPDQWAAQIMARVQLNHSVIIVTDQCDHKTIQDMGFGTASDLEEAFAAAKAIVGLQQPTVTVIPDGVAVIVSNNNAK